MISQEAAAHLAACADDLVAYLSCVHEDTDSVKEALGIYRSWQDFISTRFIDDEACQRHASERLQNADEYGDHCAFVAAMDLTGKKSANTRPPMKNKYQNKFNLEKAGRLLMYQKQDQAVQAEIDDARVNEGVNWQRFNAAKKMFRDMALKLIDAGVEVLPTAWVDVDKHSGLTETVVDEKSGKKITKPLKPKIKSRLVARGDLQRIFGRTDSPTADPEAISLICIYSVSEDLTLHVGDLDHGYFQGEKLERKLLLKAPRGGIPGLAEEGEYLLALVPIYGTKDAGRGLWRRVYKVCTVEAGMTENFIFAALYHLAVDGDTKAMVGTHVDDLIWAAKPEYEHVVKEIVDALSLGKQGSISFRFCGLEFEQNRNKEVVKTCRATTEKLKPLAITTVCPPDTDKHDVPATCMEQQELQSGVGSISWIVRMCRPGHCCATSKLQCVVQKPSLADLELFNATVAKLQKSSKRGIAYRKGVKWNDCVVAAVPDAGHACTSVYLDDWKETEPFRSQAGKLIFLATPDARTADTFHVSLVSYGSSAMKRVVRSTIQAEAYNLQQVVEEADLIRAAVLDCRGLLDRSNWEVSASDQMKSVWIVDCNSIKTALSKPVVRTIDKRLGIELASLRQQLWRYPGRDDVAARVQDGPPDEEQATDTLRWVDTRVMPTDPLTKVMAGNFLQSVLDTGVWDTTQPEKSRQEKAQKSQWRAAQRETRKQG